MSERFQPVPVPRGDGRHDIGDDMRAAIVQRLIADWSGDPDLTPEKTRQLAMWAGASVRSLVHEMGTLRDMAQAPQRAALKSEQQAEPCVWREGPYAMEESTCGAIQSGQLQPARFCKFCGHPLQVQR